MRDRIKEKREKRKLRHRRVRALIKGTEERPRLNVFKSNQHTWAQLIDDSKGYTLASSSDLEVKDLKGLPKEMLKQGLKTQKAYIVGQLIALKAKKIGIRKIVFDKGGWKYFGRVKALAEGARKEGLEF